MLAALFQRVRRLGQRLMQALSRRLLTATTPAATRFVADTLADRRCHSNVSEADEVGNQASFLTVRCGIESQAPVPVWRSAGRRDGRPGDGSWFGRAAPTGRPARWSAGPLGLTREKTRGSGTGGTLPLTRQRGRHSDRHPGRTERESLRWSCPSRRGVSGREDRRPRLWWQQPTPDATASAPQHSALPSWACPLPGGAHRRA